MGAAQRFRYGARQQIRRVGFQHQARIADIDDRVDQMPAAALVADPASNADVAVQREIISQRVARVGEAVHDDIAELRPVFAQHCEKVAVRIALRSEEHTSELQSLMRISYAVFCLKKKKKQ